MSEERRHRTASSNGSSRHSTQERAPSTRRRNIDQQPSATEQPDRRRYIEQARHSTREDGYAPPTTTPTTRSSQAPHPTGVNPPATYRSTEVEVDEHDLAASRSYRPRIPAHILDPNDRFTNQFASIGGWSSSSPRPGVWYPTQPDAQIPLYAQELDMTGTLEPDPPRHNDSRADALPGIHGNGRYPSTPPRMVSQPRTETRYATTPDASYAPTARQRYDTPPASASGSRRVHGYENSAPPQTYGYPSPPSTQDRYRSMPLPSANGFSPSQPVPYNTTPYRADPPAAGRRDSSAATYGNSPRRRTRGDQGQPHSSSTGQ